MGWWGEGIEDGKWEWLLTKFCGKAECLEGSRTI